MSLQLVAMDLFLVRVNLFHLLLEAFYLLEEHATQLFLDRILDLSCMLCAVVTRDDQVELLVLLVKLHNLKRALNRFLLVMHRFKLELRLELEQKELLLLSNLNGRASLELLELVDYDERAAGVFALVVDSSEALLNVFTRPLGKVLLLPMPRIRVPN